MKTRTLGSFQHNTTQHNTHTLWIVSKGREHRFKESSHLVKIVRDQYPYHPSLPLPSPSIPSPPLPLPFAFSFLTYIHTYMHTYTHTHIHTINQSLPPTKPPPPPFNPSSPPSLLKNPTHAFTFAAATFTHLTLASLITIHPSIHPFSSSLVLSHSYSFHPILYSQPTNQPTKQTKDCFAATHNE